MGTTKYLLLAGLGIAAVLLLTSDKANELRNEIDDNARTWADKLKKASSGTAGKLNELRNMLDTEIEGLSDDARKRIENILDGTSKKLSEMKKKANGQLFTA